HTGCWMHPFIRQEHTAGTVPPKASHQMDKSVEDIPVSFLEPIKIVASLMISVMRKSDIISEVQISLVDRSADISASAFGQKSFYHIISATRSPVELGGECYRNGAAQS
ncbi:MAG: hypothetical protein N3G75_01160, partial [Methanothrix sp.]